MAQKNADFTPVPHSSDLSMGQVSVLSGTPALAAEMVRGLNLAHFASTANLTLIIDTPAGFAFTLTDLFTAMPTLILTDNNCPEYLLDLRATGCIAVLAGGNSFQDILLGLERASSGQRFYRGPELPSILTHSERLVLQHVAFGLSDKKIAQQLGKSERTIGNQLGSVLNKLSLKSRGQAMLYYFSLRHIIEKFW